MWSMSITCSKIYCLAIVVHVIEQMFDNEPVLWVDEDKEGLL